MGFLTGKRALIVGVASKLSIASGIAAAMHREGAELAFTYQNDKLRGRVEEFASGWGSRPELCFPCDVADDSQIEAVFAALGKHWDGLDIIVHSVGFAPGDQLDGDFTAVTTREGFRIAHDISAYSFIALAKAGREMMKGRNGSLLTLSYLGAERTMPNYNVMGLAKASLEAGVRYLAGSLGAEGTRVNAGFRRADPNARRLRDQELPQDAGRQRAADAAAAQRHHRGSRQCRRLPLFGPGQRYQRRDPLRRWRLQHYRHGPAGRRLITPPMKNGRFERPFSWAE